MSALAHSPSSKQTTSPVKQPDSSQEQGPGSAQGPSNAEAQEQLGAQSSGADSGLDVVAELDPSLAKQLGGTMAVADNYLSEHAPVLAGRPAEADVDGCYQVLGYIDDTILDLASAIEQADEAWQTELLCLLEYYRQNLADGVSIVEAEGDVWKHIAAFQVEQGIAAAALVSAGMAGLVKAETEMNALQAEIEAHHAAIVEAQEQLEDIAVAELVGQITGSVTDLLGLLAPCGESIKAGVQVGLSAAATFAEPILVDALSEGGGGLDAVQVAIDTASELAVGTTQAVLELNDLDPISEVLGTLADLHSGLQTVEEVTEQVEIIGAATQGMMEAGRAMLHGPMATAQSITEEAAANVEAVQAQLVEGGQWVVDACAALWWSAQDVRRNNPERYGR